MPGQNLIADTNFLDRLHAPVGHEDQRPSREASLIRQVRRRISSTCRHLRQRHGDAVHAVRRTGVDVAAFADFEADRAADRRRSRDVLETARVIDFASAHNHAVGIIVRISVRDSLRIVEARESRDDRQDVALEVLQCLERMRPIAAALRHDVVHDRCVRCII